jgi:predicted ATPase
MFTKLYLRNFKAWKDTGDIDLKPITVLLGTNSSGKSSLLQSLLLLKQTVQSPDRSIHLNLGGDEAHDYFNFGYFDDVLMKNSVPREFEIRFSFEVNRPQTVENGVSQITNGVFDAVYAKTAAGATVTQELTLEGKNRKFRISRKDRGAYSIYIDNEKTPRDKKRSIEPERSITLSAVALQSLKTDGADLEDISLVIRRELEGIAYLGPLRKKPERDYPWNKTKPGDMGVDGGRVMDVLLASALLKNQANGGNKIIEDVSRWLKRMGVAEKIDIKQLGNSTRYEIVVVKDGVLANLRDVGMGISQVLPVLTLAYFAPEGSTIMLEEPEIHLHPLAQSELADLLVEVSKKRSIQFIVETHSEHFFRRFQTLVAKKKIKSNECALYFVERKKAQAVLDPLPVDEFGRVLKWPDKFFGDALGETREQARLVFERQKKEQVN